MRILIMGFERVGLHLVPLLAAEGHSVAVIDSDPDRIAALSSQKNVEGYLVVQPLMESLRQAGVSNADVFLALSGNDSQNAMAAQVAQHVFHVPKVICRIDDPDRHRVYEELGVRVVSPTMAVAEAIQSALKE